MKSIFLLGVSAAFLMGAALALLVSYVIPVRTLYQCFWALLLAMAASVLTCGALTLHATRRERVRVDHIVDLTVDRLLEQRGLEVVRQK